MPEKSKYSVVDEKNFIHATRSTGYRSTAAAIAELVDNSLQAGATRIDIVVEQSGVGRSKEFRLAVADNGCGMNAATLRSALRFGGSSRFDDRNGQGRFGMGLPNASLSQAKRLEVVSWQSPGKSIGSYIDVNEIASGEMSIVPAARRRVQPSIGVRLAKNSGTVVVWSQCDLLENRRVSTITQKLKSAIGRQFRYFIWDDVKIRINGDCVEPIDPLFIEQSEGDETATVFGKTLEYELHVPNEPSKTSLVTVQFSELPVAQWHSLSTEEKRSRGISKGAGASIIRAGREVDFGWYLFGEKRKENYDDWWRCEISYEPVLDEYFGITHSKQAINPTSELRAIICPDLASIAQLLNSRVRKSFAALKAISPTPSPAAAAASRNDKYISTSGEKSVEKVPVSSSRKVNRPVERRYRFKIQERRLNSAEFYSYSEKSNGLITITINTDHVFYDRVYVQLRESAKVDDRQAIECFLLAAVRAETLISDETNAKTFVEFRRAWSDALETYLDA